MAEERMVANFGFNPVYLRIWFKAARLIKGIILGIIYFAGQHCLPNLPLCQPTITSRLAELWRGITPWPSP
jgi:hypothetical protein